MIGSDQEFLPEAIKLFEDEFAEKMGMIFKKERMQKSTSYFEFWGDGSFAGSHVEEAHRLTLIDVQPYKSGVLNPDDYLKLFGGLPQRAKLLFTGNINNQFVGLVLNSNLEGMTFEGVVCKAKTTRKQQSPNMFKIKSNAWKEKLKTYCGDNESLS